ncbi:MAG: Spy/CpxP family protein refolding chaperone [Deltaproteobacteria bacterium]|nr:Spy/CpxP family protein refolding chaperone [Deltaproteobacteria bacterium]
MKKLAMTFVALFAVAALTASAFAVGPGWGRGHGRGQYGGGGCCGSDVTAVPGLSLTTEQMAKVNALRETHMKDVKPIQDKMFSKRGDLKLLWLQKSPDQGKIRQTQKDIRALRDQMEDKKDNHRLEVLKVLTPEQQEKLNAYRPGRGSGHGMRGGAGQQGGGPGMGMMDN